MRNWLQNHGWNRSWIGVVSGFLNRGRIGAVLWLAGAASASADGLPCERFLELSEDARAAYVWGLVDGAMAVQASYKLDGRLMRKDGEEKHADQSDFVAQAIVEKIRPVLHRPSVELLREMEARCKGYSIPVRTVLAYLETLDLWRREP